MDNIVVVLLGIADCGELMCLVGAILLFVFTGTNFSKKQLKLKREKKENGY